jgi:argininosuccinate lyase
LTEARKCQLNESSVEDYKGLYEKFSEDVMEVFDFEASVEGRASISGPSRNTLDRQVTVLRAAVV